ncbi:regulator of G-protein signaling 20 isoform X2 [Chrysoperla carnea]|uniref:regulator of G-protein signaling 20 isoform X2 n=1 Tax=Chrysoperla carnea TaxID=189513 RepID=UPI001D05EA14|nr:regulator of G-protein signaling 20 isoform X2 [Chrysoperla carnea]
MSCSVIDRRSNDGGSNSGCRLRGSTASLAASTGTIKGSGPQATTSSSSVYAPEASATNNTGGNASVPLRPAKPCCFCWCCCCSCSCLLKNVEDNGPTKNPNNKDLLNCDGAPPPTLEDIRSWGKSFDKLMRSSAGRKVFRDFLRCEYSEENILFWLACEELKKEANPDVVEEKARFIYEDYISILSPKEVSLDSRVREIVNRNMMEPTIHTFDEAQLQIYTLMHRDSYPRFVNSPLYKKLAQLTNGNNGSSENSTTAPTSGVGGDNSNTGDCGSLKQPQIQQQQQNETEKPKITTQGKQTTIITGAGDQQKTINATLSDTTGKA